jgi:hypothetical protein
MSEMQIRQSTRFWKELAVFLATFIPQVYLLQDAYHFELSQLICPPATQERCPRQMTSLTAPFLSESLDGFETESLAGLGKGMEDSHLCVVAMV